MVIYLFRLFVVSMACYVVVVTVENKVKYSHWCIKIDSFSKYRQFFLV